jgi:hypothetical protein
MCNSRLSLNSPFMHMYSVALPVYNWTDVIHIQLKWNMNTSINFETRYLVETTGNARRTLKICAHSKDVPLILSMDFFVRTGPVLNVRDSCFYFHFAHSCKMFGWSLDSMHTA